MAYRFAQLSLGLVSLMGPAALAAPVEMVTQVVTVQETKYAGTQPTAAPAANSPPNPPSNAAPQQPQQQQPAPQQQQQQHKSNNNQGSAHKAASHPSGGKSSAGSDSGSSGSLPGKKGVSYNQPGVSLTPNANWAYNWESSPNGANLNGATFVPMCRTSGDMSSFPNSDAEYCMAFNEPDQSTGGGGSMMSASTAAGLYKGQFMNKCQKNLGAPSVSSQGMGDQPNYSLDWLQQFMDQCSDCKIDFWPLHFYADASKPNQMQMFDVYVKRARQQIQKFAAGKSNVGTDMWFTEIGQHNGGNDQFMQQAMAYMDKADDIKAYSPSLGGNPDDMSTQPTSGSPVAQLYS